MPEKPNISDPELAKVVAILWDDPDVDRDELIAWALAQKPEAE